MYNKMYNSTCISGISYIDQHIDHCIGSNNSKCSVYYNSSIGSGYNSATYHGMSPDATGSGYNSSATSTGYEYGPENFDQFYRNSTKTYNTNVFRIIFHETQSHTPQMAIFNLCEVEWQQPQESQIPKPKPPTKEELDAQKRATQLLLDAQKRATQLLLENLDQENKQRFLKKIPIEVSSRIFENIVYKIPIESRFDKILAIKNGKVITSLCLIVRDGSSIPLDDIILTKFLYISRDEENALKIANHFGEKLLLI